MCVYPRWCVTICTRSTESTWSGRSARVARSRRCRLMTAMVSSARACGEVDSRRGPIATGPVALASKELEFSNRSNSC